MATFNWKVLDLGVENKTVDGHTDLVSKVYWECSAAQDDNGKTHAASLSRNTVIPYIAANHYVNFTDLTEIEVLEWVFEQNIPNNKKDAPVATVKTATENELQAMLNAQITPAVVIPALPWVN